MTKTTVSKNQYGDSRDFMTSLLFRKWTIAIMGLTDLLVAARESCLTTHYSVSCLKI